MDMARSDPQHEALLARVPLFESLTSDDIVALSTRVEEIVYEQGTVIFRQGDKGSSLFVIEEGEVEISHGEGKSRIVLANLFPGQYFGELSLFDGAPRSASATAVKKTGVIRLDRDDLVDFVNKNPAAALRIIAEMGDRLRQTNELMSRQVSRNVLEEADEQSTVGQRISDRVASFGGSWPFIIIFAVVMVLWMGVNGVGATRFDPYPFIFLNLILSTVAAIQAPIIMMSQNRQAAKDKLLAENDYQVNRKAELEISALLRGQAEILARLAVIEHAPGRNTLDGHDAAALVPPSNSAADNS